MRGDEARLLLGFPPTSRLTSSQIKAAYKSKAWEYHPDRVPVQEKPGAESKFKLISEAYNFLLDVSCWKAYQLTGLWRQRNKLCKKMWRSFITRWNNSMEMKMISMRMNQNAETRERRERPEELVTLAGVVEPSRLILLMMVSIFLMMI
ncbi:uncharacterized J domain-containing protein C63.13 isoform X4 [Vitis riparia]|uniref:uncharacterized J domain-containing protein C63.13 isoform X4 n=1 Tax=Vitis riparia TaxID=96939 RepID=UPI00155AF105|nr:uncharacterized J domain-containing protein C63.13 isoform X4 [Vitis riparia]